MKKEKFGKKMFIMMLIISLFLSSYIIPSGVAEAENPDIKIEFNFPFFNILNQNHGPKMVNYIGGSGCRRFMTEELRILLVQ